MKYNEPKDFDDCTMSLDLGEQEAHATFEFGLDGELQAAVILWLMGGEIIARGAPVRAIFNQFADEVMESALLTDDDEKTFMSPDRRIDGAKELRALAAHISGLASLIEANAAKYKRGE